MVFKASTIVGILLTATLAVSHASLVSAHNNNDWLVIKGSGRVSEIQAPVPAALDAPDHEFAAKFSKGQVINLQVNPRILLGEQDGVVVSWEFSSGQNYSGDSIQHKFPAEGTIDLLIAFFKSDKIVGKERVRFQVGNNLIAEHAIVIEGVEKRIGKGGEQDLRRMESYQLSAEGVSSVQNYTWVLPDGSKQETKTAKFTLGNTKLPARVFLRVSQSGFYRDFSVEVNSQDQPLNGPQRPAVPNLPASYALVSDNVANTGQENGLVPIAAAIIILIGLFIVVPVGVVLARRLLNTKLRAKIS